MTSNIVIVGIQWGDEGKGKITDLLAKDAAAVVRYQGGANAGHTVVVRGKKIVLHQIPSGMLNDHSLCVIGPAVVVDPQTLVEELESLKDYGIEVTPDRLAISSSTHVVMPYHKRLDALREQSRGKEKIGTTGRGIGPTYEDLFGRTGVRMSDFCNPERLLATLQKVLVERNHLIQLLGGEPCDPNELAANMVDLGKKLAPYIRDVGTLVHEKLASGQKVLFESAQGTLLDILHGTYPFVTSSLTTAPAAFPMLGIGIPDNRRVLGVVKAYTTRVGAGPFPTEDVGDFGKRLRDAGGEYGATTGRPRRCGYLDLPALRYAIRVNGVTGLAVTKIDVLSGLGDLKVCQSYKLGNGQVVSTLLPEYLESGDLEPIYETWKGWDEETVGVRSLAELPANARKFLELMSSALGVPIDIVSTSPDRDDTILNVDLWG